MTWWQRLWRKQQLETQLDKELSFHLDQHAADLVAAGVDPREALRQARLAIGGPEQVKEDCRDARGTRWLDDLAQDLRYGIRLLRQKPAFTAVALLTLALGTGTTTVMFTVVNGVLLKPLPFADPGRLLAVNGRSSNWNVSAFGEQNIALPDLRDFQRDARSVEAAGWMFSGGSLTAPGEPEYVDLREITHDLFRVLGAPLARGRAFLPDEDTAAGQPVAILGYGMWQRKFGGSDAAIGASATLDGKRYTIVGVAPREIWWNGEPDIYTPVGQDPAPFLRGRRGHPMGVIARLRPGATPAQAQSELDRIGRNLAAQYPDTNRDRTFTARPLRAQVGEARSTLWLLMGAVSLVLLIACANVASLLLARAVSRGRELAMRAALGAGRGRLVRQCLTESAVLGVCGGALGVALAAVGIRPFLHFWPGGLPREDQAHLDWRVLLFALGVSLLCGLIFGLAPALRVPARHLEKTLRAGARAVGGAAGRLHGGFVAAQIAIAVVLLVSAGMLGRAVLRASALDPGIDIHNVLVARFALSPNILRDPARIRAAWPEILDRARHVPGVEAVATVDTFPMRNGNNQVGYWTDAAVPLENRRPFALATSVSPDYLKVVRLPLRRGRFVEERDRLGAEPVVVIDEVLAHSAFGAADPVGRRLWIPDLSPAPVQVVGVVGHVRHWGLAADDDAQVRAQLYYPFAQVPDALQRRWSELTSLAVRTSAPPMSLVEPLRRELKGVAADQVLYSAGTLEQYARASLGRQRFLLMLFAVFGAIALLLSSIGVYGVLAHLTGQRVPEFGVRMALGAAAGDVIRLVLRQSAAMIAAGALIGIAGAIAAGRLLHRLVEGTRPMEPAAFLLMLAVLLAAAFLASYLPARRAARIDPVRALRQE